MCRNLILFWLFKNLLSGNTLNLRLPKRKKTKDYRSKSMMKFTIFLIVILFGQTFAQTFPKSGVILERKSVTANRELVLWMPNPKKVRRDTTDDIYTCPDQTRGHYYSGVAKVSLVDVQTKKTINTIEVIGNGLTSENNTLDLPYLIKRGYYKVAKVDKNIEGKPTLLNLSDYNNDGKPHEFTLFDAIACMGLQTTLIGYSETNDKVIQYQTALKIDGKTSNEFWVDYFFGQKVNNEGVWKYEVDYRGRGGALEKYEIQYDKKREIFYGTRTSVPEDDKVIEEKERPHK